MLLLKAQPRQLFPIYTFTRMSVTNFPYVDGAGLLLRTGGPNDWVNIDMGYSIIVIKFHECGKSK